MKRLHESSDDEDDNQTHPIFDLPEMAALVVQHTVIKGVFHTYAALLCVSSALYKATSLVIQKTFTKKQLLGHPSLVWHYGGKCLKLSFGANPLVTNAVCARLTQLTDLNIDGNDRLDLDSFIYNMTHLTALSLNHCVGINTNTLLGLTGLRRLSLKSNHCVGGHQLTRLISLTDLSLSDTQYVDGTHHLLKLTQLTRLHLNMDHLITTEVVSQMTWLRKLSLFGNAAIDGTALRKLPLLESLDIRANRMIGTDTLGRLTGLKELFIDEVRPAITDQCLAKLTNLACLVAYKATLISDNSVSLLTALGKLALSHTDHVTAASIKHLTRLRKLTLGVNTSDVRLWDLTHLSNLVLHYDTADFVMMGQIEEFVREKSDSYRVMKWKQAPKHYLEWHRY